jgi:hypothetical protein
MKDDFDYENIKWAGLIDKKDFEYFVSEFSKLETVSKNYREIRKSFRNELFSLVTSLIEEERYLITDDLEIRNGDIYFKNDLATVEEVLYNDIAVFDIKEKMNRGKDSQRFSEISKKYNDLDKKDNFGISTYREDILYPWYIDKDEDLILRYKKYDSNYEIEITKLSDSTNLKEGLRKSSSFFSGQYKIKPNKIDNRKQIINLSSNQEEIKKFCRRIRGDYNKRILELEKVVELMRDKFKQEYVLMGIVE